MDGNDAGKARPQDNEWIDLDDGVRLTLSEIHRVVEEFYRQVAVDSVLSVPFQSVQDWPHHIERLTHFWWVRLGGRPYLRAVYNPVEKHYRAGFNRDFLVRWLDLFQRTQQKILSAPQAALWTEIAQAMGEALSFKNEQYALILGAQEN